MRKTFGNAFIVLAFAVGMIATTSTPAGAQWRVRNGGYNNQQIQQGYQDGVNTGASDAQRGQGYNPQRSHFYRDARSQEFRTSFVNGYDAGYRQYSGAYGNGGYRNGSYGNGGYGNGRYGNGGYNNQQINAGYQQGLNTGASDGRSNKSYSPQRSHYYQNASPAYREGFVRGYDEGFRQYSRNNRYRRNNSAATIIDQIFRRP